MSKLKDDTKQFATEITEILLMNAEFNKQIDISKVDTADILGDFFEKFSDSLYSNSITCETVVLVKSLLAHNPNANYANLFSENGLSSLCNFIKVLNSYVQR